MGSREACWLQGVGGQGSGRGSFKARQGPRREAASHHINFSGLGQALGVVLGHVRAAGEAGERVGSSLPAFGQGALELPQTAMLTVQQLGSIHKVCRAQGLLRHTAAMASSISWRLRTEGVGGWMCVCLYGWMCSYVGGVTNAVRAVQRCVCYAWPCNRLAAPGAKQQHPLPTTITTKHPAHPQTPLWPHLRPLVSTTALPTKATQAKQTAAKNR